MFMAAPEANRGSRQVQLPPWHVPEQHSASLLQGAPVVAHWQWPLAQLPEQQSLAFVQTAAAGAQAQVPPEQVPEQQSPPLEQAWPVVAHAQAPFEQVPEQQKASPLQTSLTVPHVHVPPWHAPVQHSAPEAQAAPVAVHRQVEPSAMPEQHWPGTETWPPPRAQHLLAAPPQTVPGSHCTLEVQATPNDGLQP
jgi:hypothetical protein